MSIVNQLICLVSCLIIAWCALASLNMCNKHTTLVMRYAHILALTGAVAVVVGLLIGLLPHWSTTLVVTGLALKLLGERRRHDHRALYTGGKL